MSYSPSCRLVLIAAVLVLLSACASQGRYPEFSAGYPVYDCPEHLQGRVEVTVAVRPAFIDSNEIKAHSVATTGAVGRRLVVSVVPAGLRPDDRIVWSALTFVSYGGTFLGWSQLITDNLILAPSDNGAKQGDPRQQTRVEVATVSTGPGQAKIVRSVRGKADLLGVSSLDMLIMPGGAVVDDTVLRISNLWSQGVPVPSDKVIVEIVPVRHPPGLDTVQASFELAYVVREGRSGDEWICSAEGRATLVDHDAVRQPFWDLGLVNKKAERWERLTLFSPSLGGVRTVFDSPATANALASWIQATGSTQVGEYQIGLVHTSTPRQGRPYGPVDAEAMTTFRALTADDLPAIEVGAAGEL